MLFNDKLSLCAMQVVILRVERRDSLAVCAISLFKVFRLQVFRLAETSEESSMAHVRYRIGNSLKHVIRDISNGRCMRELIISLNKVNIYIYIYIYVQYLECL